MEYDWKFINSFAPWFSAIGTISAVVVSLYLSRQNRAKLKLKNSIQIAITPGQSDRAEYLVISVVNIGIRPSKITAVGWTIGLFKKQSFYQVLSKNQDDVLARLHSSDLPVTLNDGEEASWFIPLDKENNWIDMFKNNLSWFARWDLYFTYLEMYTSHGMRYRTKIGADISKRLLEALEKKVG